jgi:hypothetical protein
MYPLPGKAYIGSHQLWYSQRKPVTIAGRLTPDANTRSRRGRSFSGNFNWVERGQWYKWPCVWVALMKNYTRRSHAVVVAHSTAAWGRGNWAYQWTYLNARLELTKASKFKRGMGTEVSTSGIAYMCHFVGLHWQLSILLSKKAIYWRRREISDFVDLQSDFGESRMIAGWQIGKTDLNGFHSRVGFWIPSRLSSNNTSYAVNERPS